MRKWYLFVSLLQIFIGLVAIVMYIFLALKGEPLGKWALTLFLAIGYVVLGIVGILQLKKSN